MQINHVSSFDISRFHNIAFERLGNDSITSREISKHKVLIINANENSQEIQNQFLTKIGFVDIDFASSQCQLEKLFKNKQYSICIIEFVSLGTDTLCASYQIRHSIKNNQAVILASTYLTEENLDRCIDSGMNGLLIKPFIFNTYKKILCFYLSKLIANKIKSIY